MTFALLLAALTNAVQLADALRKGLVGEAFDLTGHVISEAYLFDRDFAVADKTGAVLVLPVSTNDIPGIGSRVRIGGHVETAPFGHVVARSRHVSVLGTRPPPPARVASFADILAGCHDARVVRTTGMLRDYFSDEIDPKYLFLILNSAGKTLYAATPHGSEADTARLDALIGHELTITGLCDPHPSGCRRKIGQLIRMNDLSCLGTQGAASANPFLVPPFEAVAQAQPADIPFLGRHRLCGRVIAVWQRHALLVRTPSGALSRIDLAKPSPPRVGESVEVVGFPETDLYRVNFTRAIWRPAPGGPPAEEAPVADVAAATLMTGVGGAPAINPDFHGKAIRLRGTVRSLPSIGGDSERFYLESDGCTLPVDVSANPSLATRLEIGSVVDVSGVCVTDIENWRPNLVFPHIKGMMIVTRAPDDIAVVRRAPWWTPEKFLSVIASLVLAVLGVLGWNRSLRALARKQGKALADEELGRLASDLKALERTHLAVELHDSVAQNLTGVSMEIDAGLRSCADLPPAAARHFLRASKTLDSCRGELRNCLWDLRSQALEKEDMDRAIRLTLDPVLGETALHVRFNVARDRFTDNTAHAVLRVIREFVTNAVRHGRASEVWVVGCIEGETLMFSVRDNGCGFDPARAPGVTQGHFGLQGVRERVAGLAGTVEVASAPGAGTKATVRLDATADEDRERI